HKLSCLDLTWARRLMLTRLSRPKHIPHRTGSQRPRTYRAADSISTPLALALFGARLRYHTNNTTDATNAPAESSSESHGDAVRAAPNACAPSPSAEYPAAMDNAASAHVHRQPGRSPRAPRNTSTQNTKYSMKCAVLRMMW